MKKPNVIITFATLYAAFYQVAPYLGIDTRIVVALCVLSPFIVLYMAYVILKYGEPSGSTFDEKFYDDREERRNGPEEMPAG